MKTIISFGVLLMMTFFTLAAVAKERAPASKRRIVTVELTEKKETVGPQQPIKQAYNKPSDRVIVVNGPWSFKHYKRGVVQTTEELNED